MQLNFASSSQDCGLHICKKPVDGGDAGVAMRLAQPRDFEFTGCNELRGQLGAEASETLLHEQGLQFERRPGKQHNDSFAALIFAAHPLPRGAAIGIGHNGSPRNDARLL